MSGAWTNNKHDYIQIDSSNAPRWFEGFVRKQVELGRRRVNGEGKGQCHVCKAECSLRCKRCKDMPDGRFPPFYCGKEHQAEHWKSGHKKACSPWNSLMALVYGAVHKNALPGIGGPEYNDYGFGNCKTMDEEKMLLGLYIGLIQRLECDLNELHEACVNGVLDKFIIKTYEEARSKHNLTYMGGYYPWFLQNQHVVKNIVVTNIIEYMKQRSISTLPPN